LAFNLFVILTLASACGGASTSRAPLASFGEAHLENEAEASQWADASAAGSVKWWGPAWNLIPAWTGVEGGCPRQERQGEVIVLTGDCTDDRGGVWRGTARREPDTSPGPLDTGGHVSFTGFGYERVAACRPGGPDVTERYVYDGELDLRKHDTLDVIADLKADVSEADPSACTSVESTFAIDYVAHKEGAEPAPSRRWSGRGRIGSALLGTVTVDTQAEVVTGDDAPGRPARALSGATVVKTSAHSVCLDYDASADPQGFSTVRWSLDGQARGELHGIYR
jgi:hypothetical protein